MDKLTKEGIEAIKMDAKSNYGGNTDAAICNHLGYSAQMARSGGRVPHFLAEQVAEVAQQVKTGAARPKAKKKPLTR